MATEKAPVALTGGAGFEYHDRVAARCLVDLLLGRSFAVDLGAVSKVRWEVRESGQLGDDLVLTCRRDGLERDVGLSLKSDKQVTSNGFPPQFRDLAWEQWDGGPGVKPIRGTENMIGLVVGELAAGMEAAWNTLAPQVRENRSELTRVLARLQAATKEEPGPQASEAQRALVQSMVRPSVAAPDIEVLQLIAQTHLLHFDFLSPSSRGEVEALADCRAVLFPEAQDAAAKLWTWLCGFAGRKRATGGTVDLPELLRELRGAFALRGHPDFDVDWRALEKRSAEAMAVVSTEIQGLGSLERAVETRAVQEAVVSGKVGVLVGPSGSGKSALAKKVATGSGARVVWLAPDALAFANLDLFENYLGLAHPIGEVFTAAPSVVVVVLDSAERLDVAAQKLVEQLLKRLHVLQHVAVLITVQEEGIERTTAALVASGYSGTAISIVQVSPPPQSQIAALVDADPKARMIAFSSALLPVLRNLKVVDWVMGFVRMGATLDVAKVVNVSTLIEWLWKQPWIEGADDGDNRSSLLMTMAKREAARLSAGTPKVEIDPAQQGLLRGLQRDGALFRRDEKVFFQHDLLGDWARLRVLIGEHPSSREALDDRARNPRWHRALQLFGVWLLETRTAGIAEWLQLVGESEDGSVGGIGDVFVEAVLVSSDPAGLLRRLWPSLCSKNGALLGRVLDRFLYVCTVPDPRLRKLGLPAGDAAAIEHSYRIPIGWQWVPILKELHDHAADVARLAPIIAARICNLWLRITPDTDDDGTPFPGRLDAAGLVVTIVRELRGQKADGKFRWGKETQVILEALLRAASDMPSEVGVLCLELAQRREWPPELQERVQAAKVAAEEQSRQLLLDNPNIAAARAKLSSTVISRGPMREPWPDGPNRRVPESFLGACLNTNAFAALVRTLPDVALEVLLAVCIEEPQHDDLFNSRIDDIGLAYWGEAKRAPFPRGPFLDFLRLAPHEGLTFVLRLVNFAARRQAERAVQLERSRGFQVDLEDAGVGVEVGGQLRTWRGTAPAFKWHLRSFGGEIVVRALQALEEWLYGQEDARVEIGEWLERLMSESESIAFAGLLIELGKREPKHLEGPLLPLVGVAAFYPLDRDLALDRERRDTDSASGEPGRSDEHRRLLLQDVAVSLLLHREGLRTFFAELHQRLGTEAHELPPIAPLRLLSERFNLANYRKVEDEESGEFEFRWPDDVQKAIDAAEPGFQAENLLMGLPMQCRRLIKGAGKLAPEHCESLWQACQKAEQLGREMPQAETESPFGATDAVCAGLAALLVCGDGWVGRDPARLAWCRSYLETTLAAKSTADVFGADSGLGDLHWDCFAAECGLELLKADPADALARRLVAEGVAAKRYAATELVFARGFALRAHFPEDFERMLNLGVCWAELRRTHDRLQYGGEDTSQTAAERGELVSRFVSGELSAGRISLLDTAPSTKSGQPPSGAEDDDESETVLDLRIVQAAFGWLRLSGASSEQEYEMWRASLSQLLNLSLSHVPADEEDRGSSGPYDFDYWVVRLVVQSLHDLARPEHERLLWEAVLGLGTRAHRWIDYFCATWLEAGVTNDCPRERFSRLWREMIDFAVASPQWTSRWFPAYDVARMVIALLGFRGYGSRLFAQDSSAELLTEMMPAFETAAARWFRLPSVLVAFMAFAASLGVEPLLVQGIRWVHASLTAQDPPDDDDLEAHLTDFLRACWLKSRATIQADHQLTTMFVELLNRASASGEHAALALRDQVLRSLV